MRVSLLSTLLGILACGTGASRLAIFGKFM